MVQKLYLQANINPCIYTDTGVAPIILLLFFTIIVAIIILVVLIAINIFIFAFSLFRIFINKFK